MELRHPEYLPDPGYSRAEMEAVQREVAAVATFEDAFAFDPDAVRLDAPVDPEPAGRQANLSGATDHGGETARPVVAGVDQSFLDDRAVSAIVAVRDGAAVERVHVVEPLSVPYVPGLLSFREGGPIAAAAGSLSVEPDLLLFDGSGRIHYREAGLATHLGVVLDVPSVGVAKRLLCGRPRAPVDGLPAGERVAIEADERVEAAEGTLLGYAVQTRQFPDSGRVNPLYVSPGHRVGAGTAAEVVLALCADVKLPEPVRLADRYAGAVRDELDEAD